MHNKTISELSKLIAKKELSSLELTNHFLDRIKNYDHELNSFITLIIPNLINIEENYCIFSQTTVDISIKFN